MADYYRAVPSGQRLVSRHHDVVRRFRRLATGRTDDGTVLLDGERLLAEALDAGVPVRVVLTGERHAALAQRARAGGAEVFHGSDAVLEAASPVRTPSGVVAIVEWTPAAVRDALARPQTSLGLVNVQDPGNVGAVIRSADAFGGVPVLALGATADPGGWKALRGAMGSTFRVPVARGGIDEALELASARRLRVAATAPAGGQPIGDVDWRRPTLVLVGGEGAGLPAEVIERADFRVTIPMRPRVSSLNVAVSAAVILYEAARPGTAA
jgi:TrmH family RNA methyltransferase